MERNVSREKCCGGDDDVGFTEKEMTEFEYFFATALGDGTACSSCIDSCKTAKCGTHKKCVMRSGQPKCVCAPKCKTKNQRPKRGNPYTHSLQIKHNHQHHHGLNLPRRSNDHNSGNNGNHHQHQHHHLHHHQSIQNDDDPTSHDAVQIIDDELNNRSYTKSDKIISIIAPIPHPSNLSISSHRSKKIHLHNNGQQSMVKSMKHLMDATTTMTSLTTTGQSMNNSHTIQQQQQQQQQNRHQIDINHHRSNKLLQKNVYSNSSLIDNNIVNVNHRRQTSVEQQFKSKFYGHDIPYPPIDLHLYDNNQFHRAVCGTDGKTYKTECQLRKIACRQESTSLLVAYKGQCQTSCKHVQCPIGQHCLEDQNLMPHCVTCSITCPPYDPAVKSVISNPARLVCGVDGQTYRNLCEIKRSACMLGRSIPVAYRGACKESANCDTVRCKDRQVCLSDLVTHRPRCVACSFKCPRRKRPQGQQSAFIKICGTNNKSYHSWCHMMRDSCNTGYYIDIKHNGVCQNSTKT
ncbi:follistatin isoform X2 [Contarinia nasturtii]|nr:follistatin isoform X2 [Contarinia nasturtii]